MQFLVNNEMINWEKNQLTIQTYIDSTELKNKTGIAIALNDKIINKSKWLTTEIQENDKLLIIRATQGG